MSKEYKYQLQKLNIETKTPKIPFFKKNKWKPYPLIDKFRSLEELKNNSPFKNESYELVKQDLGIGETGIFTFLYKNTQNYIHLKIISLEENL